MSDKSKKIIDNCLQACANWGLIPTAFRQCMTWEEQVLWLARFLQTEVIPKMNATIEEVDELEHWFENLDVQEEINNKLDEMAESGELAQIVEDYLAQSLPISDNFIINSQKVTDSVRNLEYVLTRVTPNPAKTTHVNLKGEFAGGSFEAAAADTRELIYDVARRKDAVLMSTADTIGAFSNRTIIRNGIAVNTNYTSEGWCVGITSDGELKCYNSEVSLDTLLNDWHIVNSWGGCVMMMGGESVPDLWHTSDSDKNTRQPRTILIQEENSKDIIFLHIAGRKISSNGTTYEETVQLIQNIVPTVNIAYALNTGGDVQLSIKGLMQNDCADPQLRPLWDFIYVDANINAAEYGNIEKEIADGRSTDYTLAGLMEKFLPKNYTYLASQEVLEATYSTTTNRFVCNKDYNYSLRDGDSVLVHFGDMSEEGISGSSRVLLNIHYNDQTGGANIVSPSGRPVYPNQLKNKVVAMKWVAQEYPVLGYFQIVDNGIMEYISSATDLDNLTAEGSYYSNNFSNKPATENGYVFVYQYPERQDYQLQVYIARPSGRIYTRTIESGTAGTWNTFATTDDIIGNVPGVLVSPNNDLDTLNNGKTSIVYGYQATNRPSGADSGWCITIPRSDQNQTKYAIQIYFDRGTSSHGNMYFRQQENDVWNAWKQVSAS